jgi:acyl-[acyl-carrier-protein] desaturase
VTTTAQPPAAGSALSEVDLLRELEPVVEDNLERHVKVAKEWFPHEYVPWSEGRDFDGVLGGEAWEPGQSSMSDVARTSLIVNLLTEDNLPSYHHEIATVFGRDGAWGTWVHRWTAEEGRHGTAIRDYLTVTRAVDPVALERARMTHMGAGFESDNHDDLLRSLAYVSFQELATRISHRNTGKLTADPVADQLLARIAADENLHMLFYRNLLAAALELAPDQTMRAITEVVRSFQMPGHTIEDFTRKSVQIAMAGVYDLRIHHAEVLMPVLRQWGVFDLQGLGAEGEKAREELAELLSGLDSAASRFEDKRAAYRDKLTARGQAYESV